jgi:hypothetical protein
MSITKIALIQEMLESAEASLRSAKQLLKEIAGGKSTAALKEKYVPQELAPPQDIEGGKVVEGKFDGQNMLGGDKRSYPVPANYASKSKLVPGDVLKLTITDSGNFIYKQIGPAPRLNLVGTLAYEDGQYKVIAQGKAFKVLLASVTYFKAEVGDQVAIIVPEFEENEWAAIENVIPSETIQAEMETKVTYDLSDEEHGKEIGDK